jgi:hypothetical protein
LASKSRRSASDDFGGNGTGTNASNGSEAVETVT